MKVIITRKKIKNMYLRVRSVDTVEVTAPYRMSEKRIMEFVESKRAWIARAVEREAAKEKTRESAKNALPDLDSINGSGSTATSINGIPLYLINPDNPDNAKLKEFCRRDLKARISERLPEIEKRTGLKCSGWAVRDMTSRWGSCNTRTNHLNFNLRLCAKSDEELDYVIVHELCHTKVANHGPKFKALMDKHMPAWRSIRKKLNSGNA